MKHNTIILAALLIVSLSCVGEVFAADDGIVGNWRTVSESRRGRRVSRMAVTKNADGSCAVALGVGQSSEGISDVKFGKNTITFTRTFSRRDRQFKTQYNLTLTAGALQGEAVSDRGTNKVTGKKL